MPACLSDRIADEEGKGTSAGVAEPSTGLFVEKRNLSLAGGFLYIRGIFYVMKPAPGEASASMGRVSRSFLLCSGEWEDGVLVPVVLRLRVLSVRSCALFWRARGVFSGEMTTLTLECFLGLPMYIVALR